jgi:hypothetical protein
LFSPLIDSMETPGGTSEFWIRTGITGWASGRGKRG